MFYQKQLNLTSKENEEIDVWIDAPNFFYETWLVVWLEETSTNYRN